jgi:transcription antitermination factor NusA-like protein
LKTPICSFDAKTGVLCAKCEEKLHSGQITQDDVDASVRLTRLTGKSQDVDRFTLTKGAKVDSDFVLVLRSPDILAVRSNSALAEKIEGEFKQKVWFLDSEASERGFIEGLFYPAKVQSVNQFWLPDGNKLTKVIVAGRAPTAASSSPTAAGQRKTAAAPDVKKIQKIAKAVKNMELLVEFEQK